MPLFIFILLLPWFRGIMILWWQFLFQTHSLSAASETLFSAHTLSHYLWSNSSVGESASVLFNAVILYLLHWVFFFSACCQTFPHMDSLKKHKTEKREKMHHTNLICMTKCRKWWNIFKKNTYALRLPSITSWKMHKSTHQRIKYEA